MRVLLVDDEAEVRALLKRVLTRIEGVIVVGEASDGAEALEMTPALAPDLVVLDLNMAGMSGQEALPLLREQLPQAKIAVVSGDEPDEAVEATADLCLKKGGSMKQLAQDLVALVRP
ncbi:MAG: response regulator transcription factor [Actinobacteria bacterium]|nr:response regulator transcription factor [Actinomycetota bacterium]